MNRKDREELAKAYDLLIEAKEIVELKMNEEQEKFDNLSEGLQNTTRGMIMEEAAAEMDVICDDIEDTANRLIEIFQ